MQDDDAVIMSASSAEGNEWPYHQLSISEQVNFPWEIKALFFFGL